MEINNALDKLVKQKQANCDHNFQDRIVIGNEAFCGKCGLKEIFHQKNVYEDYERKIWGDSNK